MSTLETKKIEPLSGTSVTLGAAGDAVTMPAGVTVKTNTVKDAGGNTLWTSDGSGVLSSVNAGLAGGMVFISSGSTASAASIEFTSGIDNTYSEYVFYFINCAPITNSQEIQMITSTDGGSSYGVSTTSTHFKASHMTTWSYSTSLAYESSRDLANSTSPHKFTDSMANSTQSAGGNNIPGANFGGELRLYNPSSTTYVKHWTAKFSYNFYIAGTINSFHAGYVNTTSAVNAIKFYSSSGNIEGTIAMYGIK